MHIYHFELDKEIDGMYTIDQLNKLPISTAHLKVLKAFFNEFI